MVRSDCVSEWLSVSNESAEKTLICFPYAGGGANVYAGWAKLLPKDVRLVIVQPPGRGRHFGEPAIDNMNKLISELQPQLVPYMQGEYVLYGHSLGSRVAFELLRQALERGLPCAKHFFASGSASPTYCGLKKPIYDLPSDEFRVELGELNGTPKEILAHDELMDLFEPMLRADFKLADTYKYEQPLTFPCNVSVFAGKDDPILEENARHWLSFFESGDFTWFEGGHFFINDCTTEIVDKVSTRLALI
ncbi:thioesterase [Pseudoalteromonas aurantia]|uniref:Thioesterase n=1 Tax=Pseudoalteromonas aurantia TaxID=43654 RepID=A0A5S3V693_9GAMM|nr:thioesterase [Pseudoalteromonas aurantia]TMO66820.1 thioesterase [Pseudoalteromonas aurantia]TMO72420.1 thioesterase [Pseudoalteromonas aurantia]